MLETSSVPILGKDGGLLGYRGADRDITERVRAGEALSSYADRLKQSNRELEEFAYVASHDLQEPLRKVMAFGERLRDKYSGELGEQGADYIGRMQRATSRMQTLINDLLMFSRVTTKAEPFTDVDLGAVARETVEDLEAQIDRVRGRVEVGDLSSVEAEPLQMRQLFQNIISNSLKFHKEGEAPVVEVSGRRVGSNGGGGAERYEIRFRDNGIGFDQKYTEKIFGVFQRLHGRGKYEGTGIGMALCRKIAEHHGGDIAVTSSPGNGAEFVVTLPAIQKNGGAPDAD
jgi:light-regulated signal transduction histidine kinase (bacteriophytochrome)